MVTVTLPCRAALEWIRAASLNQTSGGFLGGLADDEVRLGAVLAESTDEKLRPAEVLDLKELIGKATWHIAWYKLLNVPFYWATVLAFLFVPVMQIINAVWWRLDVPIWSGLVESVVAPVLVTVFLSGYRFGKQRQAELEDAVRRLLFLREPLSDRTERLERLVSPPDGAAATKSGDRQSWSELLHLAMEEDWLERHLATLPESNSRKVHSAALAAALKDAAIKARAFHFLRRLFGASFVVAAAFGSAWPWLNGSFNWVPYDGFGGAIQSAFTTTLCSIFFGCYRQYDLRLPPLEEAMHQALFGEESLDRRHRQLIETIRDVDFGIG